VDGGLAAPSSAMPVGARTVDRLVLTVVRSMESCFSLENCDPLQMPTSRVAASRYSNE